ncbi:MAG: tRNA (adenosine(37)-N6)-dimethylallyltransferase MiaA, partial [Solirubrobacteraceae bacterium]
AATIEPTDRQRIVRALELLDSGELEPPSGESELWTADMRRRTLLVGLVLDRALLYEQIDARVDQMLADGVEDEVRRAQSAGASATARKALGFDDLLSGDIEQMKRRTRNYARRQLTWMRKLAGATVIDRTGRSAQAVADEIFAMWRTSTPPAAALRTSPRTGT